MTSDEALVERTLAGDLSAFETLVERHRDVVYRVATRIVGEDDADDVAQDAALNALTRRRVTPVENRDDDRAEPEETRERTPVEQLEISERRQRLALKLREIQPPHRAVLVLRDVEGLSYEEIAEVMETPVGTVKGRLHRARRELIEILRRNTYEWELPQ
jgi:RNA polymerase sigma-70 factor (ECF subfamily)